MKLNNVRIKRRLSVPRKTLSKSRRSWTSWINSRINTTQKKMLRILREPSLLHPLDPTRRQTLVLASMDPEVAITIGRLLQATRKIFSLGRMEAQFPCRPSSLWSQLLS